MSKSIAMAAPAETAEDSDDVVVKLPKVSTETEWAQAGTTFSPRSRADKVKRLPPGIYQFVQTQQGWYLNRTSDAFEFSYKIYGSSDGIVKRIKTYWSVNGGNLGVLMNGIRGTGKTITAQVLANDLIKERHLPVLVVKHPVPLDIIFDEVKQDMMIIFDEFEKSHDEDQQQRLLSTVDGMSRSAHNRLFVFTTNNTTIDENFKDRPSRIHYQFEFARISDDIIDMLIEDSLPEDLKHFKTDIFDFLQTREICTIDIVKAVISEVKTFREAPINFEDMLNITKGEPPSFTVSILNATTGQEVSTVCHYFRPDEHYSSLLSGNKRVVEDFKERAQPRQLYYRAFDGTVIINLLDKCDEEFCWLAQVALPKSKTHFDGFTQLYDNGISFYLDNRPKDWEFPFTPEAVKEDDKLAKKLMTVFHEATHNETLYGTGVKAVFKIKVEPNKEVVTPNRWKVTGDWNQFD